MTPIDPHAPLPVPSPGAPGPGHGVLQDLGELERRLAAGERGAQRGGTTWHHIGDAGEPGFNGNWQSRESEGWAPAGFRRDLAGNVHLRGMLKSTGASPALIFTLPEDFRPQATYEMIVHGVGATFGQVIGNLVVRPDGSVETTISDTWSNFYLDGHVFPVT